MSMLINQKQLSKALSLAMPFVPSRPTHPVLSNVLIRGENDKIIITAFDLAAQIQVAVDAHNTEDIPGEIVIPAKLLSDLVRALPNEDLFFSFSKTNASVVIEVSNGTYTLPYLSSEEYPELLATPDSTSIIKVWSNKFVAAAKKVVYACSTNEFQQVLTGIHVSKTSANVLEFAATDGHRLAVCTTDFSVDTDFEITLPASIVQMMQEIIQECDTLQLSLSEDYLGVSTDNVSLICRRIVGAYPNYPLLIPSHFEGTASFNQGEMLAALKRAQVILNGNANLMVALAFSEKSLELQTDTDTQRSFESINCETTGLVGRTYYFKLAYLASAVKSVVASNVTFNANQESQPVIVSCLEEPSYLALIMPISVRS